VLGGKYVPPPQCPGRDPTPFAFAPKFKSFKATATAGDPAPSAAAHMACHRCGPFGFDSVSGDPFSFSLCRVA
jgi:hypothetical protein